MSLSMYIIDPVVAGKGNCCVLLKDLMILWQINFFAMISNLMNQFRSRKIYSGMASCKISLPFLALYVEASQITLWQ
jgi:hypothetical protein